MLTCRATRDFNFGPLVSLGETFATLNWGARDDTFILETTFEKTGFQNHPGNTFRLRYPRHGRVCDQFGPIFRKEMKKAAGHDGHTIKHTPASLNVLDYCLRAEVSRRMRQRKIKFSKNFRGPADAYMRRLKRTAMNIPESFVSKAVGSMRRRAAAIKAAEGGLINE